MKLMTFGAILALGFLLPIKLRAQVAANPYSISGLVIDSATKKTVDLVTLSLKNAQDQPLRSQLTKPDGSFAIEKLPAGGYTLTLICLGYAARSVSFTLGGDILQKDLGTITMNPQAHTLNTVTISANRPLVTQEIDRISYDLQADLESKTNSVLEMMRKVPMLTLDAEDNIQLKGNSNYKILINGKPSSMMERSPKDILRSMPASTIQKIEVITTPPAKYDADGLAGIINIITNRKIDNGYNGSINLSHRMPVGGPGFGGSVSVKQNKLGITAFSGANLFNSPSIGSSINRTSKDTAAKTLTQLNSRESDSRNGYFGTELSYELDSLHLISGQFNINGSRGIAKSLQQSLLMSNSGILQGYDLFNNSHSNGKGMDASINYELGFKRNKNRLLTFSYRYYGFSNEQYSELNAYNQVNDTVPDYRQANESRSAEQTFQIDYVHPANKVTIEAGIKGIMRDNKSDFLYRYQMETGDFVLDPARTNTFDNNQDVYAAYGTYQLNLKDWGFKAGVRVENTVIDADFTSTSSQLKLNYFNTVPSVSINLKLKKSASLNLGFSQRLQRPGINQLNPFIDRSNPNFETTGNPNLHPITRTSYQLGFSKFNKWNLNVTLWYNRINGLIFQVSNYNAATNITYTRYENIGKASALGTSLNFNWPVTSKWNLSVNGNLQHAQAEGMSNDEPVKNKGFMYNINLSTSLRFGKGWRANSSFYINSGQLTLQDRSYSFISTSISVNKDLVKDKLSLSVFTSNPFTKYRSNRINSFGPNFDQVSNSQQYFRSGGLTLNYRFGKLKEAIKKNKRGINNDDVSN